MPRSFSWVAVGTSVPPTQPSRTNPFMSGPHTLSRCDPNLAILSSHLIDRKARVHSQEEVTGTPQKAFPPDTNKITTLSQIPCHASDVATKKPANEVEVMAYTLRRFGQFCD